MCVWAAARLEVQLGDIVVNKNLCHGHLEYLLIQFLPFHSQFYTIQYNFFANSFALLTSFVSFSITVPITLLHPVVDQTVLKKFQKNTRSHMKIQKY